MKYELADYVDGEPYMVCYPTGEPYAQRDQGVRPAHETVLVVISDIVDVLEDGAANEGEESDLWLALQDARELESEANKLDLDNYESDDHETLQWILQDAEQVHGVHVEWNSDHGTVTTTLANKWIEEPDWNAVLEHLKSAYDYEVTRPYGNGPQLKYAIDWIENRLP